MRLALSWIESTTLGAWLRESDALLALPGMLFLHTLGMGLLAGACIVLALNQRPRQFAPLIHLLLWVSVVTGAMLLLAYPTKALTNPWFYAKLAFVVAAWFTWRGRLRAWSIGFWLGAIVLGRLLAYTYRYMSPGEM